MVPKVAYKITNIFLIKQTYIKFLLVPMGVIAPGFAHADFVCDVNPIIFVTYEPMQNFITPSRIKVSQGKEEREKSH